MIEENVTKLLKELESGNSLGERVTLVAATKTRTAEEINRQDPALQCAVYRFGSKLMVSPFQSADPEACRRFVRDHRVRWRDAWIYTAR